MTIQSQQQSPEAPAPLLTAACSSIGGAPDFGGAPHLASPHPTAVGACPCFHTREGGPETMTVTQAHVDAGGRGRDVLGRGRPEPPDRAAVWGATGGFDTVTVTVVVGTSRSPSP